MGNSEETPFTTVHETEPEIPEMKVTIEEQSVVAMCSMMKRSHSDIHMERRIHQVCTTDKVCLQSPFVLSGWKKFPMHNFTSNCKWTRCLPYNHFVRRTIK